MDQPTTALNDDNLYERYGKPLEQDHHGKYIAISQEGRVIVDADDISVVDQAIQAFGSGNFVFRRVGYSYVWKLRRGQCWSAPTTRTCDHGSQVVIKP